METEDYPSKLLSNQVSKITKYNLGRGKTSLYEPDQKDFTRLVISQLCHLNRAFSNRPEARLFFSFFFEGRGQIVQILGPFMITRG